MAEQLATRCGRCNRKLRMPERCTGRKVTCPGCRATLRVPPLAVVLAALPERYLVDPEPDGEEPPETAPVENASQNEESLITELVGARSGGIDLDRMMAEAEARATSATGPYTVRDGALVLLDASDPTLRSLPMLLLAQPADPEIKLDLRALGKLEPSFVRRMLHAILIADGVGKPTRVLASVDQRMALHEFSVGELMAFGDG